MTFTARFKGVFTIVYRGDVLQYLLCYGGFMEIYLIRHGETEKWAP